MGGMDGVWAIEELAAAVPELEARWPAAGVLQAFGARVEAWEREDPGAPRLARARAFSAELAGAAPAGRDAHRRLLAAVPDVGPVFGLDLAYAALAELLAEGDRDVARRALAHAEVVVATGPEEVAALLVAAVGPAAERFPDLAGPRTLSRRPRPRRRCASSRRRRSGCRSRRGPGAGRW
jgi:hypothetical protein